MPSERRLPPDCPGAAARAPGSGAAARFPCRGAGDRPCAGQHDTVCRPAPDHARGPVTRVRWPPHRSGSSAGRFHRARGCRDGLTSVARDRRFRADRPGGTSSRGRARRSRDGSTGTTVRGPGSGWPGPGPAGGCPLVRRRSGWRRGPGGAAGSLAGAALRELVRPGVPPCGARAGPRRVEPGRHGTEPGQARPGAATRAAARRVAGIRVLAWGGGGRRGAYCIKIWCGSSGIRRQIGHVPATAGNPSASTARSSSRSPPLSSRTRSISPSSRRSSRTLRSHCPAKERGAQVRPR